MRDIIFRGKRYSDKTWIYGSLLEDDVIVVKGATCVEEEYIDFDDEWCSVLNDTVGQFTGLLDCKGNKIFEGDIDERGVIIWSEECLGWFLKPFEQQFERDLIPLYDLSLPEIIGNIIDNPELLEV